MPFLRPYVGAREYLQGGERWILALHDVAPDVLARLPLVRERITAVRAYRQASKSKPTQKLADTPTLYHVNVFPTVPFLVVPEVSSERREYVPIGWLAPPVIPSNLVRVLENATLADFSLLTSTMHMASLRCGNSRLERRLGRWGGRLLRPERSSTSSGTGIDARFRRKASSKRLACDGTLSITMTGVDSPSSGVVQRRSCWYVPPL